MDRLPPLPSPPSPPSHTLLLGEVRCWGGGGSELRHGKIGALRAMITAVGFAITSVVAAALLMLAPVPRTFDPESCARLKARLDAQLVGQPAAIEQITNAVCDHLWHEKPPKPLVLSLHGPPGVGKSFTHFIAARSLYNVTAREAQEGACPGDACPGYKVVFGMDYTAADRAAQSDLLVRELLDHLRRHADAVVVIEEYDKLGCDARGLLKQLFDGGRAGNVTLDRAVFLLESNTGYGKIVEALAAAGGDQTAVPSERLQHTLKNMMFTLWQAGACEGRADTLKTLSLIDLFVAYYPLDRGAVRAVAEHAIRARVQRVGAPSLGGGKGSPGGADVSVGPGVLDFLLDKIEWDGAFAVEGAKEVTTAVRRYAFAPLYALSEALQGAGPGDVGEGQRFVLEVDGTGKRLEVRPK